MAGLGSRIREFFTSEPRLSAAFQVSAFQLTGLHLNRKEKRPAEHVILPLPEGTINPSFDRPNIRDAERLLAGLEKGLNRVRPADRSVALLLPEASLKSSVLTFDSFPGSTKEREKLLLWKLKKNIPSLPDDLRLSYDVVSSRVPSRVFVSVGREPVLREYESVFARAGLRVGKISLPALSLAALFAGTRGTNALFVNVEEDSLSLLAVQSEALVLYRFKPFGSPPGVKAGSARRAEEVAREVVSTVTFLEDREKAGVQTLYVRAAFREHDPAFLGILEGESGIPVVTADSLVPLDLRPEERHVLSSLYGELE